MSICLALECKIEFLDKQIIYVIGGNRTDCLKLDRVCRGKQESPPSFIFLQQGKDKSTAKFLFEMFLGSGGRL